MEPTYFMVLGVAVYFVTSLLKKISFIKDKKLVLELVPLVLGAIGGVGFASVLQGPMLFAILWGLMAGGFSASMYRVKKRAIGDD